MVKVRTLIVTYLKMIMLFSLVALAFVYAMFQGGFVSWFLFFSCIPFALHPILLIIMYPLDKAVAVRHLNRSDYKVGQEMKVEIHLKVNRLIPLLFIMVEDQVPDRLRINIKGTNKVILFPIFQKELAYSYTIPETVRGEHEFFSITIKTGDLLGFYEKETTLTCYDRLLVYPDYQAISYNQSESYYEQGQLSSPVLNHTETSNVSGVRNYMPGDRLTWINWKATAKKNEIMTKEFEERKSQDIIVLLDQFPSALFEEMVSFTASLTHTILQRGVGVGFAGTNKLYEGITIGRGEQQRKKILYQLAKAEDCAESSMDFQLQTSMHSFTLNASYMVVTSHLTMDLLNSLTSVKKNATVTLFVMKDSDVKELSVVDLQAVALQKGIKCRFLTVNTWKKPNEKGVS